MRSDCKEHSWRIEVEKVAHELIGMLRFNAIGSEDLSRKVPKVVRHYYVRPTYDGSRQNVSIVDIWKLEPGLKGFVGGDKAIRYRGVHQLARSLQGHGV